MSLKSIIISLFLASLFLSNNANAATFTYTPTDDVYYTNYGFAANFVDNLGSTGNYIPYLKFDTSDIDLSKQKATSAKLTMHFRQSRGVNEINNIGLYFVNNDSWNEGTLYNGTEIGLIPQYGTPAFTAATRPAFSTSDFLSNGVIYNDRVEWELSADKLAQILSDEKLSLAVQMDAVTDSFSYFCFNSSELKGERISLLYSNGQSYLETVTAVQNSYAPQLIIETAPVPEPSSMVLGLMSIGSLFGFRRKRKIS